MNTMLLSSIGLLCLISGCAASSAVSTRDADPVASPPVQSPAAEEVREFHIPAGDAPTALNQYSRQANRQVMFDYRAVQKRQTGAVEGTLLPSDALKYLLKDTGLIADEVNERTLAIMPDRFSQSAH